MRIKCDPDDYEAGSFVTLQIITGVEPPTKLCTNFIFMTVNFNYKYRKFISSRFLNITSF